MISNRSSSSFTNCLVKTDERSLIIYYSTKLLHALTILCVTSMSIIANLVYILQLCCCKFLADDGSTNKEMLAHVIDETCDTLSKAKL